MKYLYWFTAVVMVLAQGCSDQMVEEVARITFTEPDTGSVSISLDSNEHVAFYNEVEAWYTKPSALGYHMFIFLEDSLVTEAKMDALKVVNPRKDKSVSEAGVIHREIAGQLYYNFEAPKPGDYYFETHFIVGDSTQLKVGFATLVFLK
jgi:hypothetical protein